MNATYVKIHTLIMLMLVHSLKFNYQTLVITVHQSKQLCKKYFQVLNIAQKSEVQISSTLLLD